MSYVTILISVWIILLEERIVFKQIKVCKERTKQKRNWDKIKANTKKISRCLSINHSAISTYENGKTMIPTLF